MADLVPANPPPPDGHTGQWGRANPNRGLAHHPKAMKLVKHFKLGTTFTLEAFDDWAVKAGYLPPPRSRKTSSDGWQAHVQRRTHLLKKLRTAGRHSRMGSLAFDIKVVSKKKGAGAWKLQPVTEAMAKNVLVDKVFSFFLTQRLHFVHQLQSPDWTKVPPAIRIAIEHIFMTVDRYRRRWELDCDEMDALAADAREQIKRSIAAGEIDGKMFNIGGPPELTDGKE